MEVMVNVDFNKKCAECGKGGATDNGLCLKCITKMISRKPMKSQLGRALQAQAERRLRAAEIKR